MQEAARSMHAFHSFMYLFSCLFLVPAAAERFNEENREGGHFIPDSSHAKRNSAYAKNPK